MSSSEETDDKDVEQEEDEDEGEEEEEDDEDEENLVVSEESAEDDQPLIRLRNSDKDGPKAKEKEGLAAETAAAASTTTAEEKAQAGATAVAKAAQHGRPDNSAENSKNRHKMCFYREGSVFGAGLANRGTKGNHAGKIRLQGIKWTDNQEEWIPQRDDVYIHKSNVLAYASSTLIKYKCEDGSVYTAFPVFEAEN